ncbi:hypothetical protein [Longitalea luteola]|uniref:hypothetical protein n=1 Tax=Longitalea luteola TaxID=2812563 RepID=UPI001A97A066|nr:hypothetical protein [Longitalea luteola]
MKHPKLSILLISFSIAASACILTDGKPENYSEEGVFHLRAYMADGKDTFDFSKALRLIDSGMYLVKGNKIRRKAYHSREQRIDSNNGKALNTTIEKIENEYLIDFDNGLIFSYSPDPPVISERPITALNFDFLYGPRAQHVTKLRVLNIDTINISRFNGNPVYRGTAFMPETNDTAVFLATSHPLPLRSPINNWIPGFKHDILSLAMKFKKNVETGDVIWFVLEIYDITSRKVDPVEFIVDSSKIIRS